MAFPNSNLPSGSMPWGREVEKQISSLIASTTANEINNTARDNQLAKSYARIDNTVIGLVAADIAIQGAVEDAQAAADDAAAAAYSANIALNGLIGLGATGSGYTLNADNIIGGTITGVTLRTATSGQRVQISGSSINFYSLTSGTNTTGAINSGDNGVLITSTSSPLIYMNSGNLQLKGAPSEINLGASVEITGDTDVLGTFGVSGDTGLDGGVYSSGIYNATSSSASNVHIQGSANAFRIYRSTATSSRESKRDIRELQFNSDDYIAIKPVVFKYKEGILREEEKDWDIIGFIAEDFEDAGFGDQLITQPDSPDEMIQLRYDKMYMFLHKIVAEQQERIKALEARLG